MGVVASAARESLALAQTKNYADAAAPRSLKDAKIFTNSYLFWKHQSIDPPPGSGRQALNLHDQIFRAIHHRAI